MFDSSRRNRSRAFTLVELLIVIAIIGMLVALLLPAVQQSRRTARQLDCLNKIRNLGVAMTNYETSKGQLPGLTQLVKQQAGYASPIYISGERKWGVETKPANQLNSVGGFSWATMLLSRLEHDNVWDAIVSPPDPASPVLIPRLDAFICAEDNDALSQPDIAALTYVANSGAWDYDSGNNFKGDTLDNGVFFDLATHDRLAAGPKGPTSRSSAMKDGAGMTLMFSENIHKSYTTDAGAPWFCWAAGATQRPAAEQQLGFVWVAPPTGTTAPSPNVTNGIESQEQIGGNSAGLGTFDPAFPRFARPASGHGQGANVAFCDGHAEFLRDNVDYKVYQALMTPQGRKCVDPNGKPRNVDPMLSFTTGPLLSEKDYR